MNACPDTQRALSKGLSPNAKKDKPQTPAPQNELSSPTKGQWAIYKHSASVFSSLANIWFRALVWSGFIFNSAHVGKGALGQARSSNLPGALSLEGPAGPPLPTLQRRRPRLREGSPLFYNKPPNGLLGDRRSASLSAVSLSPCASNRHRVQEGPWARSAQGWMTSFTRYPPPPLLVLRTATVRTAGGPGAGGAARSPLIPRVSARRRADTKNHRSRWNCTK